MKRFIRPSAGPGLPLAMTLGEPLARVMSDSQTWTGLG